MPRRPRPVGGDAANDPHGGDTALARVRALCAAYPETLERASHGEPSWFAGGARQFVMYADHHHDDREAFWAAAPEGAQAALLASDPSRYFRPPYVGARGWVGVWVDLPDVDWERIEQIIDDAWRQVAPRRLASTLDPG